MTQKSIIITVIVLLLVIAGGWYLVSSGSFGTTAGTDTSGTQATTTDQGGTAAGGTGTKTTLRAAATQGGNYTCTLTTIGASGQSTGTIYNAGGKVRLDFIAASSNGTTVRMHVIRSGTTSYTWVDGQTTGVKATVTANSSIVPQPQGAIISDDSSVTSDCHPWSPDSTQFVPPTGITFTAQ